MSIPVRALILLLASAGLAVACGSETPPAQERTETPPRDAKAAVAKPVDSSAAKPKRHERPLPAFSGWALDGKRIQASDLLGKRAVVAFFDPSDAASEVAMRAATRIAELGGEYNFQVLGVASGASKREAEALAERIGAKFPILDDSTKQIQNRLGLRPPITVLGVDAEGYVVWGIGHFETDGAGAVDRIESQLRERLRVPSSDQAAPGDRPPAPLFTATVLDSEERFDLAAARGKPVLLMFFLHTCPHCHEALGFLKTALAELPEAKRPQLVGLEITGRTAAVRQSLRKEGLDFFKVVFDDKGTVAADYGVFGGVPDIFLIDAQGRIAARNQGWRPETDGPLLRMRMAKVAGAPVPMLLRSNGYSGSEVCGVCHESQHQTWQLTNHASAFDTLVTHGSNLDPECVGCHVVGFGQAGGFEISPPTQPLEDVGCESCHGRGGPHQSPAFIQAGNYEPACKTCHDTKHSLGFEYAKFLPEVSHAANAHILKLPTAERNAILAKRGALRSDVLPTNSAHVGSEACRSCHEAEFATWQAGPHAGALASLEAKGQSGDADCLRCHTTGFGREGGFPKTASAAAHPDLARVGCESCHGPGGAHVAESSVKLGSIVSLGDKCDSCVILQICGGCHDDANDPGFEFEVQDKIDRIRHGTIEAGTGKPLGESAARFHDKALLAHVFEQLDGP